MTPRAVNLLTAAVLLGLYALVSFTAPRWAELFREPVAAEEEPGQEGTPASRTSAAKEDVQRTINVKLFFEAADRHGHVIEERVVPFSSDLSEQLKTVVEELVKGSESGLLAPLDPATRVLEVFVSAGGVAYVDLSKEAAQGHSGGSDAELLAVYAVVNSITANFPSVRRVQILLEDRRAETLAGHVDLSRPLSPDLTLLAAAELRPAAGGERPPAPAPSPMS